MIGTADLDALEEMSLLGESLMEEVTMQSASEDGAPSVSSGPEPARVEFGDQSDESLVVWTCKGCLRKSSQAAWRNLVVSLCC